VLGEFPVDAGYRLLAAKYVRKQAKQLRAQFDGICAAENIEFVHRARVASRRLRAAMRIFGKCFNRKQAKRWKKSIRRIRSELGEARDKDVQIELLRGILDSLDDKTCFAGISRLLVQWEYMRERLQRNVIRAVKRLKRNDSLLEMEYAAKRMLLKAEEREIQAQSLESLAQAQQEILRRLNQLLELQDCLDRMDDQQSHHAMRIAAKRLRYTLEIVRPIYSGALDATLEAIKQVQTLLGEVHDCDVWQQQLDLFGKKERARIKSYYGHTAAFARLNQGIEYLRRNRLNQRRQCFQNLVQLWGELEIREVWNYLVGVVQLKAQPLEPSETTGEKAYLKESLGPENEVAADQAQPVKKADGGDNPEHSPALVPPYVPQSGKPAKLAIKLPSRTHVIS
jgi:CHAD domain-containing protein